MTWFTDGLGSPGVMIELSERQVYSADAQVPVS